MSFFDVTLYNYAMSFIGVPYKWGGSNPLEGLDCSGLVLELFNSVGFVPRGTDRTAQGIYDYVSNGYSLIQLGASFGSVVFYGASRSEITHVAFALDSFRVLEAGGGGHLILTLEDAKAKGAFVRISPIDYRKDRVAILKPNYACIGAIN